MGQRSSVGILALGLFAVLTVVGIAGRALPPPTDGALRRFQPRFEAALNRFVDNDASRAQARRSKMTVRAWRFARADWLASTHASDGCASVGATLVRVHQLSSVRGFGR